MSIYSSLQNEAMQLSSPLTPAAQPSSKPHTTVSPSMAIVAPPPTVSEPNNTMMSTRVNFSGGFYQPHSEPGMLPAQSLNQHSVVPQATFLTPSPSLQLNSPRCSLSPRHFYQKPQFGDFQSSLARNSFLLKTAAELGVVDRLDTSHEGIELSNIVDRITSTFPLDAHSGNVFTLLFHCKDNFVDNFQLECLAIAHVLILLKCDFMPLWPTRGGCKAQDLPITQKKMIELS